MRANVLSDGALSNRLRVQEGGRNLRRKNPHNLKRKPIPVRFNKSQLQ
jgi:hypothetical protein